MPRRSATAWFVCLACALATTAPRPAHAGPDGDDRAAAREFKAGQAAFSAGDFRRAAESFEAAYRAKPHHAPLWNAARSWIRAGEDVRAANLLDRYLREAPADAPDRDQATASLTELAKRLGRLTVTRDGATNARVDDVALEGDTRFVTPGEHVATADAGGKSVRKLFTIGAGEALSITLAAPEDAPPPSPRADPAADRRDPIAIAPPERGGLSPWFVVAGAGATAIGAGLTVAFGLDTVSKRDAFLGDPTQPRLDDAFASQTRTNVALGVTAGVALLTGVVAIFFVDWKTHPARASLGPRGPSFGGTF